MNSDNLQAVAHDMGIDHAKVKAKVTWYLLSSAHKTTISMKLYTRSYDLSIKTMHLSRIPICLSLINPLISARKWLRAKITSKHEYEACLVMIGHKCTSSLSKS
jgi:hypothetical protein